MEEKLKKMTFSKSLRGYACDEVDTYLRYMTDKYEQRSRECTELRRQMALIAAKMNEYTEGLHKTAEAEDAQKRSVQETCDNMIDEAKRQAAHILADAESEAEVIRRRAEDNAQTIAANAAREGARIVNEAARSVAARNNAADRLVEEIDSFREEVYALYSRHIAELDRLAARTNDFYDRKTAVAESASPDAAESAESAEPADPADGAPLPEPVAEEPAETDEEVPIRIDWKNRRAKRDIVIDIADEDGEDDEEDEDEESAEDGAMEVVPELPEDAADTDDIGAEDDLDALFRSLTGKNMLTPERTAESADSRPIYDGGAEYEDPEESYADSYANEYAAAEADADDAGTEPETYDEIEPDTDELGEPGDSDADLYDEPDEEYGVYDNDDDDGDNDIDDDDAGIEDKDEDAEDDTDWLLTNLKAQYAAKAAPEPKTEKPRSERPAANAAPESFDELLDSDTATDPVQDISLTGEFERIYNKEQAAKYMEEVEKQPLHVPEKPKNPKKHTRD